MGHNEHGHHDGSKRCKVDAKTQVPFSDTQVTPSAITAGVLKVPVLLAETELQIVVEADIKLDPPAVEIKRVLKDIVLTQCKLVPVAFGEEMEDGTREVTRAKLFVEGYIRKNIEYAARGCNGVIYDKIAKVPFSGFADLNDSDGDFDTLPVFGTSFESKSQFLNDKKQDRPRFDKYYFQNSVFYNEQPFCELVSANFFEIDYSEGYNPIDYEYEKIREKIVVDLTLKVLQTRQVSIG
ncbi:CsxC family protein [Pontibacillus salicampi]|uniref:CsxC family protein n=1 Tax=Pontibacillus salicampi TaxID=1449801 RepID=A0ABV6LQD3_9BACI